MKKKAFKILFTCAGRRVSLLRSFRAALSREGFKPVILGTDMTELSAALQICDKQFIVKPTSHNGYIRELAKIVRNEQVRVIIPTIDLDLKVLAESKEKFESVGCTVLVSDPEVVHICQDKRRTYRFLTANGFDTPRTVSVSTALSQKSPKWPCFIKPWDGYASRGTAVVKNRKELLFYSKKIPNPIVQQYIEGTEYTCDVYVDFDMKVRCVVPRMRIETRAGEVSKGRTVKNESIIGQTARLVETLKAGPGVITIQLIVAKEDDSEIRFIEINPRFGGGVPLSIKAGANFPKWIIRELTGRDLEIRPEAYRDNLTMLRYDGEIWL